jgi:RNA polymerase sigma factor (sigma-70 family)
MRTPDPAIALDTNTAIALGQHVTTETSHTCQAFEALVRQHQTAIFRVAYRLTGDRDEAEDLVQEALVEAFESFHRFRPGTHFDWWLFRIMRNSFVDGKRRKARARFDSLDEATRSERQGMHLGAAFSADTEIMARTLDGPVQDALDALPPEFRMVVVLADIEGLSYEEVSEVVGRPVGTVRSRLHRGRMILKEKLRAYARG